MPDALAEHFLANDGFATHDDLIACGLTRAMIRTKVRNGHLERKGRELYALAGHPPTFRHELRHALLRLGGGAAISYRTAAHLLRFDGFRRPNGQVDAVITYSRRPDISGVTIHRTGRLDDCDVTDVSGLRCTSAARTIIDLASICTERALLHAIGSAVRDGRTSLPYLADRLADLRGPGRRGVAALDRVLDTMPGGAVHSTLEVSFLEISRLVIDLTPLTQVHTRADGAIYRLDFAYAGSPLVVEVDGHGAHSTSPQRTADARRDRDLAAAGRQVIRFTSFEVFREPNRVGQDLRRALLPWFPDRLGRSA